MSVSVSVASTSASVSSAALVQLANGEYTADSVSRDPTDAKKLNLVLEKDGNYGTKAPSPTDGVAAVQSSSNVLTSLSALQLGGE